MTRSRASRAASASLCMAGWRRQRTLINALVAQRRRLRDVELIHLHTSGDAPPTQHAQIRGQFPCCQFIRGRQHAQTHFDGERVDYLPCFLSEIPQLIRSGRRPINVALIQVSPPDSPRLLLRSA
jgi:4-hydroxybutyrate CoA-transferase